MIIALKKQTRKEERDHLIRWLESYGVRTHISEGEYQTVIGLVGDTTRIDTDLISGLDIVDTVTRISEPFKKANRKFHPDDTVVRITDQVAFGGGEFQLIAGALLRGIGKPGGDHRSGGSAKRRRRAAGRRLQTENLAL